MSEGATALRGAGGALASEDREAALAGNDLTTGSAGGSVGPGTGMLVESEECGDDLEDVTPIGGVVGLEDENSRGLEAAIDEREEEGSDETPANLTGIVVRLGVIDVDFGDGGVGDVTGEDGLGVADGEADVGEAPLTGTLAGVTDDEG